MTTDFVFIHGGGQGSWVWEQTISAMGQQSSGKPGRSLALDVPGCGDKRERDTSEIGFEEIVDELISDIEVSSLKNVILVGHSQAGTLLPRMAERRPDLFRRLVFISCLTPFPGSTVLDMMGNGMRGQNDAEVGWPIDPAVFSREERRHAMFCNDMTPAEADWFLGLLGADAWPKSSYGVNDWRYDHLAGMPTSYVVLLQDRSLPVPWQERFAELVQADRVVSIDAGHQAMNTRPQALAEVLLAEASIP